MTRSESFLIAPDHPACSGHFPGRPILPGVVLLAEAANRIAASLDLDPALAWQINRVKFLRPAFPGDSLQLHWERAAKGNIDFRIERAAEALAEGSLRLRGT
ncbi:hypothetical protein [Thiocystis violacea]|uniref:hypothetical protein n=1 Tax=Thiocystis violacea TaxID=13725 RepID=UPI001905CC1E|nr:hypothetical protein [Thiocystis violacea]MBK1723547.1 hypothetical protein [Thiocystis violacea]